MSARKAGLARLTEHLALKGIAIGACAGDGLWGNSDDEIGQDRIKAHAHVDGKRKGWICIRRLRNYNATTIRHELAHLVRENTRHDEAWRREVRALGGPVEQAYRKRVNRAR